MKVLSLFDGMSVAQQALRELGFTPKYYASEIDQYAIAVTQANYPDTIQLGSVVELSVKSGEFDLLVGGSPCQDLSIAKKDRKGLDGERSGLFFEYLRIRDEVKPKYFILENVNSMPKEAKEQISAFLGVEPVMINASLVSAQNRKRLFWVGKLKTVASNGIPVYEQVHIPQPEDRGIVLKDILLPETYTEFDKAHSLTASYNGAVLWNSIDRSQRTMVWNKPIKVGHFNKGGQGQRVYSIDGKSVTLSALGGGWGAKTGLYQIKNYARKLEPVECLRLQSMPDDYFDRALVNGKKLSKNEQRKMCGNAFNKEVIKHIIKLCK